MCQLYCFMVKCYVLFFFFFKQKTAYEMRISVWSSDVCSSDLRRPALRRRLRPTFLTGSGADQAALAGELEHCLLQLFQGAHLDLADALAADLIDLAQILERLGIVGHAAFGTDVTLALVQRFERFVAQVIEHAAPLPPGP